MGMSTNIVGFKPPDDHFKKMQAAWLACTEAGIDLPTEVEQFFDFDPPDENGVEIDLDDHDAVKEWQDDMCSGFQIDLTQLDPDIKILRFYNSW